MFLFGRLDSIRIVWGIMEATIPMWKGDTMTDPKIAGALPVDQYQKKGATDLTAAEKRMWAESGREADPQLYQAMKARGMSDEEFGELWAAFG